MLLLLGRCLSTFISRLLRIFTPHFSRFDKDINMDIQIDENIQQIEISPLASVLEAKWKREMGTGRERETEKDV